MSINQVPLSYTVNVSLSATPSGLGEYNTNTVCLLSNETTSSLSNYLWAVNAQDVINAYGTDSLTAKMATELFTPSPNLRTGRGQVLVFNYKATNATAGTLSTSDISANINNFKSVSDGKMSISIDGNDFEATALDFTNVSDVNDIVEVLKAKGLDCDISVYNENQILFTSRQYGTSSKISISESTSESGTDLYNADYLDGATSQMDVGTNETGATLAEAVAAAEEVGYFGGILTTQFLSNDAIVSYSQSNQGKDHIYYESIQSLNNIQNLGGSIKSAGLTKTRLFAYTSDGANAAKVALAGYATIAQSTNYSGSDTALTMNLKTITGISADTNMNSTWYNVAKQYGVDIYGNTEGLSVVYSFDNGYYTDDATNLLWLKKALEVAGFNYLRQTNTKIPQTEKGMTGLKQAYETKLAQGVGNGVIGTGLTWNNSIPFGDPSDFQRNIEEKGYYIYSIPISQQSQAEREERIAPVVQIALKLSGAIHSSDVVVTVQK